MAGSIGWLHWLVPPHLPPHSLVPPGLCQQLWTHGCSSVLQSALKNMQNSRDTNTEADVLPNVALAVQE